MKKIKNPKLIATHQFSEINVGTEEYVSEKMDDARILIRIGGKYKTILVAATIVDNEIKTSVLLI